MIFMLQYHTSTGYLVDLNTEMSIEHSYIDSGKLHSDYEKTL